MFNLEFRRINFLLLYNRSATANGMLIESFVQALFVSMIPGWPLFVLIACNEVSSFLLYVFSWITTGIYLAISVLFFWMTLYALLVNHNQHCLLAFNRGKVLDNSRQKEMFQQNNDKAAHIIAWYSNITQFSRYRNLVLCVFGVIAYIIAGIQNYHYFIIALLLLLAGIGNFFYSYIGRRNYQMWMEKMPEEELVRLIKKEERREKKNRNRITVS